jgi:hypothetical protein
MVDRRLLRARGQHAVAAWAGVICSGAALASPGVCRADAASEQQADHLFKEAKALTDAGNYPLACPKLEESQRLDPALGTQYNLADCYEHTARPLAAQRLFLDVAALAHAAGKSAREKDARQRAASLDSQLAHLTLRSPAPAGAGLEIRRDGQLVAPTELDAAIAVEPGVHAVDAAAPGKSRWHGAVAVAAGTSGEVSIPPLADAPVAAAPAPIAAPPSAPAGSAGATLSGQRIAALSAGGAGVVSLAVGSIFGGVAMAANSSAKSICPQPNPCVDQAAANKWSDATSAGNVSTVGFVAGGVLLGAAAALWFTAPSTRQSGATHIEWVATPAPGGASFGAAGSF